MRFFFDTEFIDDGHRIHLISIGIAAEDGRTYYAELESPETLKHLKVSQWVKDNVYPHLENGLSVQSRPVVAEDIKRFVGEKPEFWAYVADYDWVALSQLYGPLTNRPKGWPWTALDTFQLPNFKAYVIKPTNAHNALSDAVALRASFEAYEAAQR